jgi:RNA recognition motif-containing protein
MKLQGNRLYVGNLDYSATNGQLEELFSKYGKVSQIDIIPGKGFAFVEMADSAEAEKAKDELNGTDFIGRTLKIDEARPRRERPKREFKRY